MRDTIVIGAGLSGLMAALQLAEAGRRPLVLAKGQGATHWTPGTIDIWGAVGDQTLREAHDIGASLRRAILNAYPNADVIIHKDVHRET